MIIKELQISNVLSFKYYEDVSTAPTIIFGHDLNIFIGENGSGKSTALEVLNFIFKRVLFTQYNFDQDTFSKRSEIAGPQRKGIIGAANSNNLNGFRLDPTWGFENKPQKIKLLIQLDDIDRKNIDLISSNGEKLASIASIYSNVSQASIGNSNEEFAIEITLNKSANNFSRSITPNTSGEAFNYLSHYNFYKQLIKAYNFEYPDTPIDELYESFALISSFRNYHAFTTSVTLQSQSSAQQIQQIHSTSYAMSMNSNDNKEPSIFSLVRLRIADRHFELISTKMSNEECEAEVNKTPFLQAINKSLKLVNLECKIRLVDKRTWQYSFEFRDIRRNVVLQNINSLSAGQKAIIHLVFEAYGRGDLKGGLVIIDEPEIHLHYQFQHEYLRVIKELNKDQKCQYVLVTHSESLINSSTIHNVKRFSLNKDGHSEILSPNLTTDQRVLIKILDNTRATYAFFGKKVVLVEGDTDRYFFKALLAQMSPSSAQEVSILDIGGKGGYRSWRSFFEIFGLTVYFIGDFDNVFSLDTGSGTIVSREVESNVESGLKQEKLDNLSPEQLAEFKTKFFTLQARDTYLKKPPRELWKPLLDKFIKFCRFSKAEKTVKTKAVVSGLDASIEAKYSENIFILKRGDLETYLGLDKKKLPHVIDFCNSNLTSFVENNSPEFQEMKMITDRIVG